MLINACIYASYLEDIHCLFGLVIRLIILLYSISLTENAEIGEIKHSGSMDAVQYRMVR